MLKAHEEQWENILSNSVFSEEIILRYENNDYVVKGVISKGYIASTRELDNAALLPENVSSFIINKDQIEGKIGIANLRKSFVVKDSKEHPITDVMGYDPLKIYFKEY